tara:strand:+ start:1721 stop:2134 length:414 start_codon:yes stop_codon:yes gene_type:complete
MNTNRGTKICQMCGSEYLPNNYQYKRQRYCSKKCKNKRQWEKKVESGHIRRTKGGYNRSTYIKKWMEARLSDNTAPCHYCKARLSPDDFVLDHKIPVKVLNTRDEVLDASNLVVACRDCNQAKGSMSYESFMEQIGM